MMRQYIDSLHAERGACVVKEPASPVWSVTQMQGFRVKNTTSVQRWQSTEMRVHMLTYGFRVSKRQRLVRLQWSCDRVN